jgi:hypothetical protein
MKSTTPSELRNKLSLYENRLRYLEKVNLSDVANFTDHWEQLEFYQREVARMNGELLVMEANVILKIVEPKLYTVTTDSGVIVWELCRKANVQSIEAYFNFWKFRAMFRVKYYLT